MALHINEIRVSNNRRRKNTIPLFERLTLADRKKRLNWLIELVDVIHINECQSILYQSRHIDKVLWKSSAIFFFHLSFFFFFTFPRTHVRLLFCNSKYTYIGRKSFSSIYTFAIRFLVAHIESFLLKLHVFPTYICMCIYVYMNRNWARENLKKNKYVNAHTNIYRSFRFTRSTFISFLSRNSNRNYRELRVRQRQKKDWEALIRAEYIETIEQLTIAIVYHFHEDPWISIGRNSKRVSNCIWFFSQIIREIEIRNIEFLQSNKTEKSRFSLVSCGPSFSLREKYFKRWSSISNNHLSEYTNIALHCHNISLSRNLTIEKNNEYFESILKRQYYRFYLISREVSTTIYNSWISRRNGR